MLTFPSSYAEILFKARERKSVGNHLSLFAGVVQVSKYFKATVAVRGMQFLSSYSYSVK